MKRRGDDRKFLARVLAVGTECDIALLTVDDDAFWEGVSPLAFGSLPHLQVHMGSIVTERRPISVARPELVTLWSCDAAPCDAAAGMSCDRRCASCRLWPLAQRCTCRWTESRRQNSCVSLLTRMLPLLQDAVAVVGYPIGGDTISVTSGGLRQTLSL